MLEVIFSRNTSNQFSFITFIYIFVVCIWWYFLYYCDYLFSRFILFFFFVSLWFFYHSVCFVLGTAITVEFNRIYLELDAEKSPFSGVVAARTVFNVFLSQKYASLNSFLGIILLVNDIWLLVIVEYVWFGCRTLFTQCYLFELNSCSWIEMIMCFWLRFLLPSLIILSLA